MEGEKQKQMLDREIRDMISALNRRLEHLHKPHRGGGGGSSDVAKHDDDNDGADNINDEDDDDDHGVRIITLAGSNVGATLRSDLDNDDHEEGDDSTDDPLTALVNSNFQAINNSLMLGGSYTTNDPGVHMEISDNYSNQIEHNHKSTDHVQQKRQKKEGGSKKKGSKTSKTDHQSEGNSGD